MTDSLPFDPPYKTRTAKPDGSISWIEVFADGSSREATPPLTDLSASVGSAAASPPRAAKPEKQVTILNVPFAQKDEAKELGARWDPKRRKWYVPQGVDAAPFERWLQE